jgi:hypothetical protein
MVMVNSNLSWLKPIFDELGKFTDDYISREDEPPYWYNEGASVSVLASAAIRSNSLAIAEYRRDKKRRDIEDNRQEVNGRCDLYIAKNQRNYIEIEAKQIYVGVGTHVQTIRNVLDGATKEAGELWWGKRDKRAGLVFLVFRTAKDNVNTASVDKFMKELKEVKSDLVWYWCYNSSSDKKFKVEGGPTSRASYCYPAFGVIARLV